MSALTPTPLSARLRSAAAPAGALRSAWRQPLAIVGVAIVVAWLLIARSSRRCSRRTTRSRRASRRCRRPSRAHLFGTDELGRDVLSRVLYGARAVAAAGAAARRRCRSRSAARSARVAGYFGGWVDERRSCALTDLVFAFPAIILAMVVTASLGPSIRNAVLALVVVSWPTYARVVRGLVLVDRRRRVRRRPAACSASSAAPRAVPRRAAERGRPGDRARDARPRQRDPAALGAVVPRPRRAAADAGVGLDGRRPGRSTSRTGGWARSRASRSSPPCWPSTSSATACATSSTRGRARRRRRRDERAARGREPDASGCRTRRAGRSRSSTASTSPSSRAQVFGIAGESGSGKTMTALALLGLLPRGAHRRRARRSFDGRDLLGCRSARCATCAAREIAMVFQDPMTSLHPMLIDRRQLTEHVRRHLGPRRREARARARGRAARARCASPTREARCALTRTSSPAACASGSRSRSRSPASRSC